MSTHPWDIYAEQLLPVGYGHPLWLPEPSSREIELGDVGWLKEGGFHPLFNSMNASEDSINRERGVPSAFAMFNLQNLYISEDENLAQPIVYSKSIRTTDVSGNMGSGA